MAPPGRAQGGSHLDWDLPPPLLAATFARNLGTPPWLDVRTMLEAQVGERGDRDFLIAAEGDRRWTYSQFDAWVNQAANWLLGEGIGHGDRVALVLPNLPEFLCVYLATMKLGAVSSPINPHLTAREMRYMLENAGSRLCVTNSATLAVVTEAASGLSRLASIHVSDGGLPEILEAQPTVLPGGLRPPAPQDEAEIIYTSGTTGNPKGVLLTHSNFCWDSHFIARWHSLGEDDRAMCILPLFHVNGEVVTVMSVIAAGASLVLPERFSASRFWSWAAEHEVVWFSAVPTNLSILLATEGGREGLDLSHLRFCICGAAPLPVEVHRQFERTFSVPVIEGYGLSETTCYSSFNPHPPEQRLILGGEDVDGRIGDRYRRFGSVGLAVGNQMQVWDASDRPLPDGERGEMVVRGPNVMREYFANPEATEEAFRGGWFHTGDIGYRDPEGYFTVTDRKKDMIIRGGENIYPREIDEVLYKHPAVRDAATLGVPHATYGEEVVAFVVLRDGALISAGEITAHCARDLAAFKVPREILFIDEIPKGPSGKLLRRKLAEIYQQRAGA